MNQIEVLRESQYAKLTLVEEIHRSYSRNGPEYLGFRARRGATAPLTHPFSPPFLGLSLSEISESLVRVWRAAGSATAESMNSDRRTSCARRARRWPRSPRVVPDEEGQGGEETRLEEG